MSNFWDSPVVAGADLFGQVGQLGQNKMDGMAHLNPGTPGAASGGKMGGLFGALGGFGMLAGGATMAKGYSALHDSDASNDAEGWFDMVSGGATAGQGVTSMLTPIVNASSTVGKALGPLGAGFGVISGGLQLGKGVGELQKGDAQGVFDVSQGGANAIAGGATILGAPPVAAVAGAASVGLTIGNLIAKAADSDLTKTGVWGKGGDGKNKSAMDFGASWGTWVDGHIGDKDPGNPSVLGGLAAGAGGVLCGLAGAGQAAGKAGKALWDWL